LVPQGQRIPTREDPFFENPSPTRRTQPSGHPNTTLSQVLQGISESFDFELEAFLLVGGAGGPPLPPESPPRTPRSEPEDEPEGENQRNEGEERQIILVNPQPMAS
jgi:hypothetical protein